MLDRGYTRGVNDVGFSEGGSPTKQLSKTPYGNDLDHLIKGVPIQCVVKVKQHNGFG